MIIRQNETCQIKAGKKSVTIRLRTKNEKPGSCSVSYGGTDTANPYTIYWDPPKTIDLKGNAVTIENTGKLDLDVTSS